MHSRDVVFATLIAICGIGFLFFWWKDRQVPASQRARMLATATRYGFLAKYPTISLLVGAGCFALAILAVVNPSR